MIIFSVFNKQYNPDQNEMQHQGVVRFLKRQGIFFRETLGTFDGVEELGFSVCDGDEELVKTLCNQYNQDCYLAVSKCKAYLHYTNGQLKGKEFLIGIWTPGKVEGADYTYIDGQYYHCSMS